MVNRYIVEGGALVEDKYMQVMRQIYTHAFYGDRHMRML